MCDKPQVIADRPRFTPDQSPASRRTGARSSRACTPSTRASRRSSMRCARTGELENTLIVYISDNGFMHGEHRALAEKVLPYEPSIRSRSPMRGPGIPRGRVDPRPSRTSTCRPTILDAADVDRPARPRWALAARPARRPRRGVGPRHPDRERQGRERRPAYRGIRTYRYVYVEHLTTGEYELYDLARGPVPAAEPGRHRRYREVQRDLKRRLRALRALRGADCHVAPGCGSSCARRGGR